MLQIDKETKDTIKDKLATSGFDSTEGMVQASDYYKVSCHFTFKITKKN